MRMQPSSVKKGWGTAKGIGKRLMKGVKEEKKK